MFDLPAADAASLRHAGVEVDQVRRAGKTIVGCLLSGGKLLTLGNGGSAADAQHLAAELVGRFELERPGWPAVALTTNTSALTAIGNDLGINQVFARQVSALGRAGDVALAISTSGSSPNVLVAAATAREHGLTVIALCGAAGSELGKVADIEICVPGGTAARVQERHLLVEHCLCRMVEKGMVIAGAEADTAPPGSVVSLEQLLALRSGWRAAGRVVVWTNGCFDLLHRGHVFSLQAAKALGDVLVVGVNGDASVRRLKGDGRPLLPAHDRAELLAALRMVDYVMVFDDDTPTAVLDALRPDIHTKGADYAERDGALPERDVVEAYGGRVEFLPLAPSRSSSSLRAALDEIRVAPALRETE